MADTEGIVIETTDDLFLGGRLSILQPRSGHRSGIEAVLLGASCSAQPGETVLDIGSGVGVAGLIAGTLCPSAEITLVDIDQDAIRLASKNAPRNGFNAKCLAGDVTTSGALARLGLTPGFADHAIANPPFDPAARTQGSDNDGKRLAHSAPTELFDRWMRFAASAIRPAGTLTVIHRADELVHVLSAMGSRFGDLVVVPIQARPDTPATRILIRGHRDRRGDLKLMPPLVLHGASGNHFREDVDAVLRGRARIDMTTGTVASLET
ncbi:MAG: methyltransferase [Pseudomonadota bacterium]